MVSSWKVLLFLIAVATSMAATVAVDGLEDSISLSAPPSQAPSPSQENLVPQFRSSRRDPFTSSSSLAPILLNLGFQELAMAVPSLPPLPSWTSPSTIFAPTDASITACESCFLPRLLHEHVIPGLFTFPYLQSLPFGTKIETLIPGRCITITSRLNTSQIFIGGVEITHPDLFNNGFVVVHGIDGFLAHLSPFSCNIERHSLLPFPPSTSHSITRLMLRDVMLRLRISGYTILSLALRVKYPELVTLKKMTIFALDDASIFSGGSVYVREVRFHIVPNKLLLRADLEQLPLGTMLPTLESGEMLVVTAIGGTRKNSLRINYVGIRNLDLVYNDRIAVHRLFMPFPRLDSIINSFEENRGSEAGIGFGFPPNEDLKWINDMEDREGM